MRNFIWINILAWIGFTSFSVYLSPHIENGRYLSDRNIATVVCPDRELYPFLILLLWLHGRSHVIYIFCPKPLLRCLSRLCYTKRSCRTMRTTTTTMCEVYSGQLSTEMFINSCKTVDAPEGIKTNGPKISHGIRRRTKWRTNKKGNSWFMPCDFVCDW